MLDPALLRPGRLDRKIEIPLPNEAALADILKIHAGPLTKHGDIDVRGRFPASLARDRRSGDDVMLSVISGAHFPNFVAPWRTPLHSKSD